MPQDLTLKLRTVTDSKSSQAALQKLQKEVQTLSGNATKASRQATAMGAAYTKSAKQAASATDRLSKRINHAQNQMRNFMGVISLTAITGQAIGLADEYKLLNSRLKLVTESSADLSRVQDALHQQALNNRQDLGATIDLYARMQPALKDLGRSQSEFLDLTNLLQQSMVVSGATTSESAAALRQFSQAVASGVLRGDEFNSLMENSPALMRSFAVSMDIPVSGLRKLAEEGALTAEALVSGLLSQKDNIAAQFADIPLTVGQSLTNLRTQLTKGIGELDNGTGSTGALAQGIALLANNLDVAAKAGATLATVYAGKVIGSMAATRVAMLKGMLLRRQEAAEAAKSAAAQTLAANTQLVQQARIARAQLASATTTKAKAVAELESARASVVAARGTDAYAAAQLRLVAAQRASVAASRVVIKARGAEATATNIAAAATGRAGLVMNSSSKLITAASGTAALAVRGLGGALAFIGGPVGLLITAGMAAYAYREEIAKMVTGTDESKEATIKHAAAMATAKDIAYSHVRASEKLKAKHYETRDAALAEARANIKLAQSHIEASKAALIAANEKAESAKSYASDASDGLIAFGESPGQAMAGAFADQSNAEINQGKADATHTKNLKRLADTEKQLKQLEKTYSLLGKTKDEVTTGLKATGFAGFAKLGDDGDTNEVKARMTGDLADIQADIQKMYAELDKGAKSAKSGKKKAEVDNAAKAIEQAKANLDKQIAAVTDKSVTFDLEFNLRSKGVSEDKIAAQVKAELAASTQTILSDLKEQEVKLTLSDTAYRRHTLTLQKYNAEQIRDIQAQEAKNKKIQEGNELRKKATDALKSAQATLAKDKAVDPQSLVSGMQYDLKQAGVGDKEIAALSRDKLGQSANELIKKLGQEQQQLKLSSTAYREVSLRAMGYNSAQVQSIQLQEAENKKIQQGNELRKKAAEALKSAQSALAKDKAVDPQSLVSALQYDLKQAGVGDADIAALSRDKLGQSASALIAKLNDEQQKLKLSATAYRGVTLQAKGYNATQIQSIQLQEAENKKIKDGIAIRKKAASALKSAKEAIAKANVVDPRSIVSGIEYDLKAANVSEKDIEALSRDKLKQSADQLIAKLEDEQQKLKLSATAYRKVSLEAMGYNDTQTQSIQLQEAENRKIKEGVAARKKAAAALKSAQAGIAKSNEVDPKSLVSGMQYDLKKAGVNEADIQALSRDKLKQSADQLIEKLEDEEQKLRLSAAAYREVSLQAMGYSDTQVRSIQLQEAENKGLAAAISARKAIAAEALKLSQTPQQQFEQGLQDQGVDVDVAKQLSLDKTANDFEKVKQAMQDNRNELTMTGEAYRALGLEIEQGFSPKQAAFIQSFEAQNEKLKAWKGIANSAFDSVGDKLLETVMTGKADWGGMIKSLIAETFKMAVIKPFIDSLKNSFGGFLGGLGGGGDGGGGGLLGGLMKFLPFAQGGAFSGNVQAYANGGAFTNQIVNQPTAFMGGGKLSVMGEAGPEAVMPLTRMSSGSLGVNVDLTGTPPVSVNMAPQVLVHPAPVALIEPSSPSSQGPAAGDIKAEAMASQAPVINLYEDASKAGQVEESKGDDGRRSIDLFVANIRQGGKAAGVLESTYGVKRKGTF